MLRLPGGVIAKDIVRVTERFLRDATFVGRRLKLTPNKGISRVKSQI